MQTAEQLLLEKDRPLVWVPVTASVQQALVLMVENNIGSVAVRRGEEVVGLWTERSLVGATLLDTSRPEVFDPGTAPIRDYMETEIHQVPHTDTIYQLMDLFLGLRVRHLLVERQGDCIGLLSIGDVLRACLLEKSRALEALNTMVSWEYHEEWKWTPTRAGAA